ncbi:MULTISPECIES: hypothetical protein [unclassified Listeria]|uniref:hypothetical protein n=1 Tax=unclassified Listeria TaxID=2642072 RepID=UPI000B58C667|nr:MULTISPECIES: hypothetical protein [unclassified Listeria]
MESIQKMLVGYNEQQIKKIQDFLISEIDEDTQQETIDFIKSCNMQKVQNHQDILYAGDKYEGIFIEGNQYLIGSSGNEVLIIDSIGEEHGMGEEQSRIRISISNFTELISRKKEVLEWIRRS